MTPCEPFGRMLVKPLVAEVWVTGSAYGDLLLVRQRVRG